METNIAVDVMGGDFQEKSSLGGVKLFLENHTYSKIHLFGPTEKISPWYEELSPPLKERVFIHHTDSFIDNNTTPREALRNHPNSSMKLSIESIKSGLTEACVSSGNTGALVALSTITLKTLESVSRPAISKSLPVLAKNSHRKEILMLDLGANPDSNENNLLDNARLADILFKIQYKKDPEIRLLNLGMEDIKGTHVVKEAHKLLQNSNLNYKGFIEADQIFDGICDIIVTDGFSGNIALKTSEGLVKVLSKKLKNIFTSSPLGFIAHLLVGNQLKSQMGNINPKKHNGACILGLNGIIVKSHGNSDPESFYYALKTAAQLVENKMIARLMENQERS